MKIVKIDGGIGRVLCSSGPLMELSKRDEVIVLTSWPEIFQNNPYIYKIYKDGQNPYLFDDIIKQGEFIYPEPYFHHLYYNQKCHLIESFNEILNNINYKQIGNIYLTSDEIEWGKNVVSSAKKASGKTKAIVYQPYGSGAVLMKNGDFFDKTYRSLNIERSKNIINNISNFVFINLSHIPISHPRCWQQDYTTRQIISVIKACDMVVTIDSLASHVAAIFKIPTVLILGGTYSVNVGYDELSFFTTYQKDGYPKNYFPNRFEGFVEKNQYAMEFSSKEMEDIVEIINEKLKA